MNDEAFWATALAPLGREATRVERVSGGDICQAFSITTQSETWFAKRLPSPRIDLLKAEQYSLEQLARVNAVRVPRVIQLDADDRWCYLLLEHLSLQTRSDASDAILGRQLAQLHRHTGDAHGWPTDNWIGLTHQPNAPEPSWSAFFVRRRLEHQVTLLSEKVAAPGLNKACTDILHECAPLLVDHEPQPSLLHGDLWGGNYAALADDTPVIFDPASYYGDRETDLAMSRLFGGFGPAFYQAYEAEWPLPEGHELRVNLYQLYHLLNHANLFGSGYVQQVSRMIVRIRESLA